MMLTAIKTMTPTMRTIFLENIDLKVPKKRYLKVSTGFLWI